MTDSEKVARIMANLYEPSDDDHHPLCPVIQPEGGDSVCECDRLKEADREASHEMRRDR